MSTVKNEGERHKFDLGIETAVELLLGDAQIFIQPVDYGKTDRIRFVVLDSSENVVEEHGLVGQYSKSEAENLLSVAFEKASQD